MKIIEGDEFQKELKKFLKKYRTLESELAVAKLAITAEPRGDGTKHWNILKQSGDVYIIKMRMMCRAVRGSDFRLIYKYDGFSVEVMLIEMYYKGNKAREDVTRYEKYLQ